MTAIGVSVLGATGSIGASTLDVIERHSDKFRLVAATANRDAAAMQRICAKHHPGLVVMCDDDAAQQVADFVADAGLPCTVRSGAEALIDAATVEDAEQVMAAVVGGAGLAASLAAAAAGKRVLLANKEALVMAGDLFMRTVRAGGAELLPIDSEHNAIFQCLPAGFQCGHALQADSGVEQIILTASGGPFLGRAAESLAGVTVDEAVAHPNWSMGRKISVDSATMMNKGLELIEAAWLFGVGPERLAVLMHPQSVVHSLVRMADGSVLAQLGMPDMRTPIAYSMAWPARVDSGVPALDLAQLVDLEFRTADRGQFRCLALAEQALAAGGDAAIRLNAANEIAVEAFLAERLGFTQIAEVIDTVLEGASSAVPDCLDSITACDSLAREHAREVIAESFAAARGRSQHV